MDWWKDALQWHRANRPRIPVLEADLTELTGRQLLLKAGLRKGDLDVLDGSPPCQGFSSQNRFKTAFDPRNSLPLQWARLVVETGPQAAIMENVRGMARPTTRSIVGMVSSRLKAAGYQVVAGIINAADYGVPQSRGRLYLIALKGSTSPSLPPPTVKRRITFQEAVTGLPAPEEGEDVSVYPSQVINAVAPDKAKWKSDRMAKAWAPVDAVTTDPKKLMHSVEMRKLTLKELVRVCGFPDGWLLPEDRALAVRLLGNAVPPPMAEAVGRHVLRCIQSACR